MASITGWKERWPSMTALSMMSSDSSLACELDHQHAFLGAGDDEVEGARRDLVERRVHDELAVEVADAGGADRAHERHAARCVSAADVATIATMSGSFSRSCASMVTTTSVSLR